MSEKNEKQKQITLLEDQDQIVNNYLESLLSEVAEYSETETQQETAEIVTIRPTSETVQEVVPEVAQRQTVEQQIDLAEEESADQDIREAPDWAQEPFQCLLLRIDDMTLGIPLLALDNIVKWETDLTTIPFQPKWHLGVLQNRNHKIAVVDTAKLLMPEKAKENARTRENGSHILIVGDNRFGLACDSLAKPLVLNKEDVHWSGLHPDRPWMAGTIREKLSVLLDINALLEMIRHE